MWTQLQIGGKNGNASDHYKVKLSCK